MEEFEHPEYVALMAISVGEGQLAIDQLDQLHPDQLSALAQDLDDLASIARRVRGWKLAPTDNVVSLEEKRAHG